MKASKNLEEFKMSDSDRIEKEMKKNWKRIENKVLLDSYQSQIRQLKMQANLQSLQDW